MDESKKTHWEQIYSSKAPNEVSWFQSTSRNSAELIEETGVKRVEQIIDVGGGASTLVDDLLDHGFKNISILDISSTALEHSKHRLGDRATLIEWLVYDIRTFRSTARFSVWHDRAVFHFLTDPLDRKAYMSVLNSALRPGGHVVIATFAIDGPQKCSGLEIVQYSTETLSREFGAEFELQKSRTETHQTPWNSEQKFIYCVFKKTTGVVRG